MLFRLSEGKDTTPLSTAPGKPHKSRFFRTLNVHISRKIIKTWHLDNLA